MKIGIDSYCFHRLFGEVYEGQKEPMEKFGYEDFLRYSAKLKVDGVSMETCFFESTEESYLQGLKDIIDEAGFETVVAWGHPDGLEGGKNPGQLEDLKKYFSVCDKLGAKVMRVVGSSLAFRNEPHGPQIKALIDLFKEPVKMAEDRGIKLAMENHFDFEQEEIAEIVEGIGSESFGITFDTGNALRIGDNPKDFAEKLGKYIFATHTKDVMPIYGGNPKEWYFLACVPVGKGCINMPEVTETLLNQGYNGMFAIEIDYPHPDFRDEYAAVKESVKYLKKLR